MSGYPARPVIDRWREKVRFPAADDPFACWEWTAAKDNFGYGKIGSGGKYGRPLCAHRVAYEHFVGPVPDGLDLDHLCRNPGCVNPDHLEPVTHAENIARGYRVKPGAHRKCTHDWSNPENVYAHKDGNSRCRACRLGLPE